jgi:glycosyltransferase involved in cell wall biosynthesis
VHKAHPEVHTAKTLRMADERFKFVIQRADTIICCSENTRRDLLKYYKVNEKSIQRVYQGVDHKTFYPLRPEEKEEALAVIHANGVSQPFILFVGTIEPRKNLQNLLHAFVELKNRKKFSGQLAVIGMRGWMCDEIEPMVEALGIEKDVVFLGYLSDKELKYFYNLCEAYAYPSLYEGFGFPIVEAFCCGAPVVTSNVSSCPEIAGDAALTADPYNPLAIADALSSIVNDAGLSATLRERALKRAAEFSFDKTAAATLDVYRQTLAF